MCVCVCVPSLWTSAAETEAAAEATKPLATLACSRPENIVPLAITPERAVEVLAAAVAGAAAVAVVMAVEEIETPEGPGAAA